MNGLCKLLIFSGLFLFPISEVNALCPAVAVDSILACKARNPWLGDPVGECGEVKNGYVQHYAAGDVYYSATTGVHEVNGRILDKYNEYKGPDSLLGLPTTDEQPTPDGVGRYNHFENGSIYWHPATGAHIIYGLIREKWAALGWEKSPLGFPISDEMGLSNNGRVSRFQCGNIYYHPVFGTHPVLGYIFIQYSNNQWETGSLGYPTSDPGYLQGTASRVGQTFQGGTLFENPDSMSLRSEMERRKIDIRDQNPRGTCSVFSMDCLLEYAYTTWCGMPFGGWASHFSEEYSNHAANIVTGRTDDGDFFKNIAAGYDSLGVVVESRWPYSGTTPYDYNYYTTNSAFLAKWDSMKTEAKDLIIPGMKMNGHFLKPGVGSPGMTTAQFDSVLIYLKRCIPVAIGRAHSLAAVGFVIKPSEPGGGYVIFKNSWGVGSGDGGYITETFQFVKDSTNDAYVYDIPIRSWYPYSTVAVRSGFTQKNPVCFSGDKTLKAPCRVIAINGRTVATLKLDDRRVFPSAAMLKNMGIASGVYTLVRGAYSIKQFVK